MVIKKYAKDFDCAVLAGSPALTLDVEEVSASNPTSGTHTRSHGSGWVITGRVHEDWFTWVNDFVAYHSNFGFVAGDFEDEVCASSEDAFKHFWEHHQPQSWDYWDI